MRGFLENLVDKKLVIHQFLPQLLIYLTHLAIIYFKGFSFSGEFVFNYALISIFALLIGFRFDVDVLSSSEENINNNFNMGLFAIILIGGLFLILQGISNILFEKVTDLKIQYIILSSISLAFIELYSSLLLRLSRVFSSLLVKILPIFFFYLLIATDVSAIDLLTYSLLLASFLVLIVFFLTFNYNILHLATNLNYLSVLSRNSRSTVMSFLRLSNINIFIIIISTIYGSYQLGVLSNIIRSASICLIPISSFIQTKMLLKMSESSSTYYLKFIWIKFFKYVMHIGVFSVLIAAPVSIFLASFLSELSVNLLIFSSVIIVISRISLHFLEIFLHKLSITKSPFFLVFIVDLVSLLMMSLLFNYNINVAVFSYSLVIAFITIISIYSALKLPLRNLP